jgi:hypothetical protein
MMNEANNNATAVSSTQTMNAPLCEERHGNAQSAIAQAKKQTLEQPMKQAIKKQSVRELAVGHNTAQDQHSKANGAYSVFATGSFAGTALLHLHSDHQYAH